MLYVVIFYIDNILKNYDIYIHSILLEQYISLYSLYQKWEFKRVAQKEYLKEF